MTTWITGNTHYRVTCTGFKSDFSQVIKKGDVASFKAWMEKNEITEWLLDDEDVAEAVAAFENGQIVKLADTDLTLYFEGVTEAVDHYLQGATGEVATLDEWINGIGVDARINPVGHADFTQVVQDENGDWVKAA
jgi:hypothetical protein